MNLNQGIIDVGVQNSGRFANASSDDETRNQASANFLPQIPEVPVDEQNWKTEEEHYDTPLILEYWAYFEWTQRDCEVLLLGDREKKDFCHAEKKRIKRLKNGKSILDIQYPNANSTFSTIEEHLKELEVKASNMHNKKTFRVIEEIKSGYMESLDNTKNPDMCEEKSKKNSHLLMDMPNGKTEKGNNEKALKFKSGVVNPPKDLHMHLNPYLSKISLENQCRIVNKCNEINKNLLINSIFKSIAKKDDKCKVNADFEGEEFSRLETNKKLKLQNTLSIRPQTFQALGELQNESEIVDGKRSKTKSKNSDSKFLKESSKFRPNCANMVPSKIAKPGQSNHVPFQENLEFFERNTVTVKNPKIDVKLNSDENKENEIPAMVKTMVKHNIVPTLQKKL